MMQQETLDVLRHIAVHGSRTRAEVIKAFPKAGAAVTNLATLGYIAGDGLCTPQNFIVTKKGKERVANPNPPRASTQRRADLLAPQLRALPPMRTPAQAKKRARDDYRSWDYVPTEYEPSTRPGAMVAFTRPSRVGSRLYWPDGRVTDIDGNPHP